MVELLARGSTGGEIAALLAISLETVRVRIQAILTKLGVHSRLEAAAFMLRPDPPTPPPLAASAALAIPFQRAEDVPRHVGKPLRRTSGSALQVV